MRGPHSPLVTASAVGLLLKEFETETLIEITDGSIL